MHGCKVGNDYGYDLEYKKKNKKNKKKNELQIKTENQIPIRTILTSRRTNE